MSELVQGGIDEELALKKQEYFDRINYHIANVKKAFDYFFRSQKVNLILDGKELSDLADILEPFIDKHDASKFTDDEFEPYRITWFPTQTETNKMQNDDDFADDVEDMYEGAWEHHQKHNDHHPDFYCWIDKVISTDHGVPVEVTYREKGEPTIDMALLSILHMLCDWEGMGYENHKGGAKVWWNKNREKISKKMTPNTAKIVDILTSQLPDHEDYESLGEEDKE